MNIIVTCHSYYPNHDGVQFITQHLCEEMAKKGHNITVITNGNNSEVENEKHNKVNIIRINARTKHTVHIGDRKKYIKLIKMIASKNDAIVNVCTQCATTDWLLPHLNEIKIPKILYLHSMWDFGYSGGILTSPKAILSKIFGDIRWRYTTRIIARILKSIIA